MQCPNCGTENPDGLTLCSQCGCDFRNAPAGRDTEGDATGGIIPYKNPKALLAYYLGLFSLFPLLGLPLGIAAFTLGILGLKDKKRNPVIKGSVHAGIGIGCGCLFSLIWGAVLVLIIIGLIAEMR